jgi:hypothetical protein
MFLIGVVGGGVQLGPLGTVAISRPIVPARGDYDYGEIGGMMDPLYFYYFGSILLYAVTVLTHRKFPLSTWHSWMLKISPRAEYREPATQHSN